MNGPFRRGGSPSWPRVWPPSPGGGLELYGDARPGSPGIPVPVRITPAEKNQPRLDHPWDLNLAGFSPDGTAAATVASVHGRVRLLVFDLTSGDTLLGPAVEGAGSVSRIPRHPLPVPAAVEAVDSTPTLGWGKVRPVAAVVQLADGADRDGFPMTWTSSWILRWPRPGRAWFTPTEWGQLVVSAQDWQSDTVLVRYLALWEGVGY